MKPIYSHLGGAVALSFTLAACVPAPDSTPAPTPSPTLIPVTVTPAPTPAPPPPAENWIDNPQTSGSWSYRTESGETLAVFSTPDGAARAVISCRRGEGRVGIARAGAAADQAPMTIRTETATRSLTAQQGGGSMPMTFSTLQARDPLLDAIALTRGRFAVENAGLPTLYLPAWAEVTRVIEDCR